MATSGRGTRHRRLQRAGAVDAKHHLIVAHEVTNVGHDRRSSPRWRSKRAQAIGQTPLTVLADRGYFEGDEILECEQAGITRWCPSRMTSNNKAEGRFDKATSSTSPNDDEYRCPAGQRRHGGSPRSRTA